MSSSRMAPDLIQFCYRKSSPFSWHRRSNFLLNVRKRVLHNVLVLRPPPIKTTSGRGLYHAAIFLYRHNLPWKKFTFVDELYKIPFGIVGIVFIARTVIYFLLGRFLQSMHQQMLIEDQPNQHSFLAPLAVFFFSGILVLRCWYLRNAFLLILRLSYCLSRK